MVRTLPKEKWPLLIWQLKPGKAYAWPFPLFCMLILNKMYRYIILSNIKSKNVVPYSIKERWAQNWTFRSRYWTVILFFRQIPSELTGQNSSKLCHMTGVSQICKCTSKICGVPSPWKWACESQVRCPADSATASHHNCHVQNSH